jgi:hypothetical protein
VQTEFQDDSEGSLDDKAAVTAPAGSASPTGHYFVINHCVEASSYVLNGYDAFYAGMVTIEEHHAYITSFTCCTSVCSFYDAVGQVEGEPPC